ncbi:hypothetical protein [Sphingomonas sp. Sph1(2015)]|nr:hypothetical protein [Sphingomonas sp. Sph1(2015)]
MREDALVETANRRVAIPDVSRLHQLAGFDAAYLHSGSAHGIRAWTAVA